MNEQVDKRNYDIASISRPGKEKRANYVQDALQIDRDRAQLPGQFVKIFADIFLKKEAGAKSYF